MKDFIKFLIFCLVASTVGYMCGVNSTNNPLMGFGLCLIFVFAISYGYAIVMKMYNGLDLPDFFGEPFPEYKEEVEQQTEETDESI